MIYLITDTHLYHDNIIKYCDRPFNHNSLILRNLSTLKEDDVLIHLGDISFTKGGNIDLVDNIKCKERHLIRGNHDRFPDQFYLDLGWETVNSKYKLLQVDTRLPYVIAFSHYPLTSTICPIRWKINIHGHFHNNPVSNDFYFEYKEILTHHHYLLCLENEEYKPVSLESCIKPFGISFRDEDTLWLN